jgi:hypothetical protein
MAPSAIWVGGRPISKPAAAPLVAGSNPILLRYDGPGTGWFVVSAGSADPPAAPRGSLAMRWLADPGLLSFDVHPGIDRPVGWYRFLAAPGLKSLTVAALGEVSAWADGRELVAGTPQEGPDGSHRLAFLLPDRIPGEAVIAVRIKHARGLYGGAALVEPFSFECGSGQLEAGDWSKHDGLESYSGGILYRRNFDLPGGAGSGRVTMDLGAVSSSAEVSVNGRSAGVRIAPPWRWDVTSLVRRGANSLEVLVYNTLSNHYLTIPTRYRGSPASGLLGPARLILETGR